MRPMSTYDCSTLYTSLLHNLINDKLIDIIERTFQREGSPYLACNDRNAFFTSENPKNVKLYVMRCVLLENLNILLTSTLAINC